MQFFDRNLSDREISVLQYLGDYVIHNLYKNLEIKKVWLYFRLTNTGTLQNQKLVSAMNRGGLWATTENMQKIFLVVEK